MLALTPPLACAITADPIPDEHTLREECSAHAEAGMLACLTGKADQSRHDLQQAEQQILDAITMWDEDAKQVRQAKTRLASSSRAFAKYRNEQCELAAALGGGAIGNALDMRRQACIAALNGLRAQHLRRAATGLPAK